MRNLKKLLALVVACVMVFGVVASAAVTNFPDVDSTAKYAEAVKVLSALNIINGDDKGNFNPDQNVTRAEMAKILCAMISKASFGQTATKFDDVTAAHWASGYVKYAQGLGIINGYSDTAFGPEDDVTYEQAIKLIVAALGYTYMAEDKGGYPAGYMMVAADLKITDKVTITDSTAPAKRSDIAILVYNAMEVNLMERVSYGTEAKYEPVAKNLLNNKLGVYSMEGVVTSTYMQDTNLDEGEINYSITKISATTVDALDLVDLDPATNVESYALSAYYCQDASASDLLYYASKAYVAENEDGDWEIIAVVAKTAKTKEVVFDDLAVLTDEDISTNVEADEVMAIDGIDMQNRTVGLNLGYGVFSYWTNADHEGKGPETLKVAGHIYDTEDPQGNPTQAFKTDAILIINNEVQASNVDYDAAVLGADAGSLKVIDTNNDGYYDLFVLTNYYIAVIDSVSANTSTIRFKSASQTTVNTLTGTRSMSLDTDTVKNLRELTITIDGEAAEVADLQQNDVVYIAHNGGALGANFDPTFVEIIAVRNTVEGKVMQAVDTTWKTVVIGSEEYDVHSSLVANFPATKSEGTFYLTADGVIAHCDTTASISDDYAYVYKVGTSSFGDKSLRMLTAEGEDVTYDIADRIEINGVATTNKKATEAYTSAQLNAIFGTDVVANIIADTSKLTTAGKITPVDVVEALVAGNFAAGMGAADELKLIAYDVSGTDLTTIYLPTGAARNENDYGVVSATSKDWVAATNKFKGETPLAASAKVFMIEPNAEFADWKVVDASALVDEKNYTVSLYGYNADGEFNIAYITSGTSDADTAAALAYYVKSADTIIEDENGDEEDAVVVTFIQGGETVVKHILKSESSYTEFTNMAEGTAFIYSLEDDGTMANVDELFVPMVSDLEDGLFAGNVNATTFRNMFNSTNLVKSGEDYMYTSETQYEADNEVMAGIVTGVASIDGGLKLTLSVGTAVKGSDFVYLVPEAANVVVLNNYNANAKTKLYAATADVINPSEFVPAQNGDIDTTDVSYKDSTMLYYAMVRLYNDVVTDVMIINFQNSTL